VLARQILKHRHMDAIVCYEACGRGRIHLSCIIRMHLGIFFGIIYVKGSFGVKIHVLHLDYWEMDTPKSLRKRMHLRSCVATSRHAMSE
jgi:hypothetical protein